MTIRPSETACSSGKPGPSIGRAPDVPAGTASPGLAPFHAFDGQHVSLDACSGGVSQTETATKRPLTRREIERFIRLRDGDGCFYCGATPKGGYQLAHVTPKSRGGVTDVENFVLACPTCNYEKYTHPGWLYVVLRERGPVPRVLPVRLPFRRPTVDSVMAAFAQLGAA